MNTFYKRLSPHKKMSLSHSMRILTKEFLSSYEWDMSIYKNKEDVMNDLYFYWFRNSAEKKYAWCNNLSDDVFSEDFVSEMKITLYIIFCKLTLRKSIQQLKNRAN